MKTPAYYLGNIIFKKGLFIILFTAQKTPEYVPVFYHIETDYFHMVVVVVVAQYIPYIESPVDLEVSGFYGTRILFYKQPFYKQP